MHFSFKNYDTEKFYDEMFSSDGKIRPGCEAFKQRVEQLTQTELMNRQHTAERALMSMGITFNVYSEGEGTERIMPLDIIPRVVAGEDWNRLEKGLIQRITALNMFIDDIYNDQKILDDGVVPRDLIETSKCYLEACKGLKPPKGIWCHITGTDLIRGDDGTFMVLEDNLRCPSGVSYMLENRELSKQIFPEVLARTGVRPVSDYPARLFEMLKFIADRPDPNIVVLTPGIYNSAYFEHSYLAQQMGVELVDARDLVVSGGYVKMRTTRGFEIVDVIYRRLDDTFLDPQAFNPHSLIGIPGIFDVYKKGRVALANAPGTGVADDKVIYAYVPRIIKYYLDQEAMIPNVQTYICREADDLKYVLENVENLVIKEANEAGGYGMLIGPKATKEEHELFRQKIKDNPRNYIAQPVISLSRVPCIVDDHAEGRHVDLRPYILYGDGINVIPGGLTRVALRKGSLVVNSSQGGGGKDTWVTY
ncbi:circularly permuted type 2 ATP-grasp protein [Runella sp. CRIBMP]|uniref:Circularly permuted type 2 ATP-grasp protein n=1 Tax=Runella salmonicolor TaxID=2950278 RepID=A0ABT1FX54_9BACT|nr:MULTISPECIES: circularly permuted type 2 ATP-grasp protein [Runella]MCP1385278.1 circularly permuted type 2 ATP-grasp protein [Runella salmonicolor]NBB21681.1 circularly permuted type 2 ATP-grasp protein [Runella sp. CRIBMP]